MARQYRPAGLRSITIAVPENMPEITLPSGQNAFRPVMEEGTNGLDLERSAAQQALDAAGLSASDVELIVSASFPALPEPCIGNATPLAYAMGMEEAASYNVECACAGGLVAMRNACLEVQAGQYDNVLVTVSCPYSPTIEPGHPATSVIGDAAYAMVIGPTGEGQDFLGAFIQNSGPTCELLAWVVDEITPSGIRLDVTAKTAGQLENWAMPRLNVLAERLFAKTGKSIEDVRHFAINAPTPSFMDRAVVALGGRREDGVNTNRLIGNVGPALSGAAIFYGAHLRDFQPGDLVFCCSVGSEASLTVGLFEWPEDVALGAVPKHASAAMLQAFEDERLASAFEG